MLIEGMMNSNKYVIERKGIPDMAKEHFLMVEKNCNRIFACVFRLKRWRRFSRSTN